jgi:small subunit ribosomal protein S3
MGQKVSPIAFRVGVIRQTDSVWYVEPKKYAETLHADYKARKFLKSALAPAGVSRVRIARLARNSVIITVEVARPGVVIGRKGEEVEKLKKELSVMLGLPVSIIIQEVKKPDLDANLVSDSIAQQLIKRVVFRRAMKKAISSALRQGAKGIKVCVAGRLGGAEIARTEWMREGQVPLHTLRADVDYGFSEAKTTAGIIGVKVWIYKGESQSKTQTAEAQAAAGATGQK